jgi:hypothetical protein
LQGGRANTAAADQYNMRPSQSHLPRAADLRQNNMAGKTGKAMWGE